jgi:mono/diheme cytochrome c family protein
MKRFNFFLTLKCQSSLEHFCRIQIILRNQNQHHMRKLLLSLSAILLVAAAVFFPGCNNESKEPSAAKEDNADSLKAVVERGKYLANHVAVCIDCHSKRDFGKFSFPPAPGTEGIGASFPFSEVEGIPGEVWPPNITPKRLGSWTDDEIARAIAHGVNKSGDTLFPIMPYYNYSRMAKEDLYSIIAYLRTLAASDSTVPPRKLKIPMSVLPPLPEFALEKNTRPDPSDKVKYGEYLVTIASCGECHTPRTKEGAPDFGKAFSGGFVFATPMFKVAVANITPDSATGIGAWTEDAFVARFRTNSSDEVVNKDHGRQNTMMPWAMYGKMKEEDLRAIYAYLRTAKPVTNKVEKWPK